ncbi:phosphatase PAP2 family protein [Actinospica durhamensis]|uniref:Phosphatase PAP2 family protein n=1 Tax=Actinospica durhamensis TaxID=1508375 RepID=A0A941EUG5_9ACTN|nr:diacylglycerol kinase family protein [Actinospica durhamensis]MBR7836617.1 phosphatase PAP2 family protein [Actinospica durhamensis]
MIALGLLVTRELPHLWPLSAEDGVDRWFAARRDRLADDVSGFFSTAANTVGAGVLTLAAILWARRRCGRWTESAFIAFCVLVELSVFLITTCFVHRPRPAVSELDVSPPTSSFPSGHTAAAVALYGAVALLVYTATRRRAAWLLLLVPVAVGGSRLYRGMHHPSDVAAGALLGGMSLFCAHRAVPLTERSRSAPQDAAVLIVNGSKADDDTARHLLATFSRCCADAGLPAPRMEVTHQAGEGAAAARTAVGQGAGLIAACGGDGTVGEIAAVLAGTDVPLGIVPLGTGNLLAMNLGVPRNPDEAIGVLTHGVDRRIDVGRFDGHVFLGMAGLGLDAAMVRDAPDGLKKRAGWAAYVVAAVRNLSTRLTGLVVEVDGRTARFRGAGMLLVGNIGRLQAGFEPLPEAEVDDGLLDVAVVAPSGPFGWLRAASALHRPGRRPSGGPVHRDRGRRISIRTRRPAPREADGEVLPDSARTEVEVWPRALTVRLPAEQVPAAAEVAS